MRTQPTGTRLKLVTARSHPARGGVAVGTIRSFPGRPVGHRGQVDPPTFNVSDRVTCISRPYEFHIFNLLRLYPPRKSPRLY